MCEEHLRGCERFYRLYGGGGVALLGIIVGDEDPSQVKRVINEAGVTFPQVLDSELMVSREYGVSPGEFSVVLVSRGGVITGMSVDPGGDIAVVLEEMLTAGLGPAEEKVLAGTEPWERTRVKVDTISGRGAGSFEKSGSTGTTLGSVGGFIIGGISRLRFLSVSSNVPNPVGAYGERVTPGNMMSYRMELELKKKLTHSLIVGGLVRLSNEGREVLEAGPEYLGSEWGSAFAEFEAKRFSLRLGYYDIHSTPLTLMRWDWSDNPRIGGDAGCGCGAAAGVLLMESLEELGPDLRFEGARVQATAWDISGTLFYAVPVRALRTYYKEYRSTGRDFAHYSKEVAGLKAQWARYFSNLNDVVTFGTSVVHTWEDESTVDFESLGYTAPVPWTSSTIASVFSEVPLFSFLSIGLEHVFYNRRETNNPIAEEEEKVTAAEAHAGVYGLSFKGGSKLLARFDYIRTGREFHSPFAAISYEPNREGIRLSGRVFPLDDELALSFFLKRLREIENEHPELPFERGSTIGFAADVELDGGVGGSAGWMKKRNCRENETYSSFTERETMAFSLRFRFNKSSYVQAQFERIVYETSITGMPVEKTNIASIYFSSTF